ncbi:MAG: LTA synthase family protein [Myxococcales bacterium]|nr:LTA synthase family protein [Myxococcales bacterium]
MSRLRRFLIQFLTFPGRHFRPVLLGNLVPWALLAAQRTYVTWHELAEPRLEDLYEVNIGDAEAWGLFTFACALGLSWLDPSGDGWRARLARSLRSVMHAFVAIYFVCSSIDLLYFSISGSRVDWDALEVIWRDLAMFWPVLSSEFQLVHAAVIFGAAVLGGLPLFWNPPSQVRIGRIVAFLLLAPYLWHEQLNRRPKAIAEVRSLQNSLFEHLYLDGTERRGDRDIPPAPGELAPLVTSLRADSTRPNVVIVFLESVGAARTTVHDPTLPTTPNLARLATEGLSFRSLFAVVPHTSKALVATLCGTWPRLGTAVTEAEPGGLPGRCLPELLREHGWRTAFFQSAQEDFEARYRLIHNLRFETLLGRDALPDGFQAINYFGLEDLAMLPPGLDWSAKASDRPFLAVYLTLTSHHGYGTPTHWTTREFGDTPPRKTKHLNAVGYVDAFLGQLVEGYRKRGLLDNTVFLILGDHGEGFGEHGRYQHDLLIWEEGMHIPGVLWGKPLGERKGWIEGNWQQIDLMPTLLELVGIEVESGYLSGQSAFGPPVSRVLYHSCWRSHRCLARREGTTKFIDHYRERGGQLFELASDPEERSNLVASADPAQLDAWRTDARNWRGRIQGRFAALRERWLAELLQPDSRPPVATWGGQVSMLDCTMEATTVTQGASGWLGCTWRAEEAISEGWEVRTQLLSAATGAPRATEDLWFPVDGHLPTWRWEPGKGIHDSVRIKVPPDFPLGPATVAIDWKHLGGRDAPRTGGEGWLRVGEVEIVGR